jgi:hypothetical protein
MSVGIRRRIQHVKVSVLVPQNLFDDFMTATATGPGAATVGDLLESTCPGTHGSGDFSVGNCEAVADKHRCSSWIAT